MLRGLRPGTEEAEWDRKYASVAARLEDLMELQRADPVADAARATKDDARLVQALLDGELDLR